VSDEKTSPSDTGFREKLLAMLEWLAERDPVAAARLVAEYTEDLLAEVAGGGATPAGSKG
jgi:hypothetical protein